MTLPDFRNGLPQTSAKTDFRKVIPLNQHDKRNSAEVAFRLSRTDFRSPRCKWRISSVSACGSLRGSPCGSPPFIYPYTPTGGVLGNPPGYGLKKEANDAPQAHRNADCSRARNQPPIEGCQPPLTGAQQVGSARMEGEAEASDIQLRLITRRNQIGGGLIHAA
jgi:hypothetical protein